jgi:hypothetical protein
VFGIFYQLLFHLTSCDVIWNENELPGNSTTPVLLLSVIQDKADAVEDSPGEESTEPVGTPHSSSPAIPLVSCPSTPPLVKQEMPEGTPHLFFNL